VSAIHVDLLDTTLDTCEACDGDGFDDYDRRCTTCHGAGFVYAEPEPTDDGRDLRDPTPINDPWNAYTEPEL
jgi:hypothetical protein